MSGGGAGFAGTYDGSFFKAPKWVDQSRSDNRPPARQLRPAGSCLALLAWLFRGADVHLACTIRSQLLERQLSLPQRCEPGCSATLRLVRFGSRPTWCGFRSRWPYTSCSLTTTPRSEFLTWAGYCAVRAALADLPLPNRASLPSRHAAVIRRCSPQLRHRAHVLRFLGDNPLRPPGAPSQATESVFFPAFTHRFYSLQWSERKFKQDNWPTTTQLLHNLWYGAVCGNSGSIMPCRQRCRAAR